MTGMAETVLVAATDPHIAYLLGRYCRQGGFAPVEAASAAQLVELTLEHRPALVILELDTHPDSDLALAELRTDPRTSAVPVIIYSASGRRAPRRLGPVQGYLRETVLYSDFAAALCAAGLVSATSRPRRSRGGRAPR